MTTAEMLARLNDLRTAAGMKPIKAWKGSRTALEAAIEGVSQPMSTTVQTDDAPVVADAAAPMTLADWCRENGINPKVARAKLRRAGAPRELSDATIAILGRVRPPVTSVS